MNIMAFGLAYWKYDLYVATAVLMATMTLFVGVAKALGESLTKLQILSWLLIMVLGGATLAFRDEAFIKWKPTVVNAIIGVIFVATHFVGKRTLIERFLAEKTGAPALKLRRVNGACAMFFFLLSYINFQVAFYFSTTVWVQYKIFGNLALNLLFVSGCIYYLKDHLQGLVNGNSPSS